MKPHQNITKTITSVTSWKIDGTKQRIDFESDSKTFYVWNVDNEIEASFHLSKANWIMKLCGLARECDNWELEIGGKDIITFRHKGKDRRSGRILPLQHARVG